VFGSGRWFRPVGLFNAPQSVRPAPESTKATKFVTVKRWALLFEAKKNAIGSLRPSRSAKESADLRSLPMGNENKDSDQVVENRVLELQSL
jgi:hypothetical protein